MLTYLMISVVGYLILGYAAWWDYRVRRIPNLVWLVGLIPCLMMIPFRTYWLDVVFFGIFVGMMGAFYRCGLWGGADVKGFAFVGFLMGTPVAILSMVPTYLIILMKGKNHNIPFITYYAFGVFIAGTYWVLWGDGINWNP